MMSCIKKGLFCFSYEIESKLGLNVKIINKKNNSGKVIIEYKSLDQFDLISKKLRK